MKTKEPGIGKEIREGGFKKGYYSLPYRLIGESRAEICRVCYRNNGTFHVKLHGKAPFRIYEIEQIDKYFNSHNINAWTGETITKN